MSYTDLRTEEVARLPILQGGENDYGDYDYMITDVPQDTRNKRIWHCRCDSCGKERLLVFEDTHYWNVGDGSWDGDSWCECLFCKGWTPVSFMRRKVNKLKHYLKKRKKALKIMKNGKKLNHKQRREIYAILIK